MQTATFIVQGHRLGRRRIRLSASSSRAFIADRIFDAFACEALEKCGSIMVYQPRTDGGQAGEYVFQLAPFTIPFNTENGFSERVRVRRACRWERSI